MARPIHRTKPGGTYFVTTNTWERRPLFHKQSLAEIVERKLFECRDRGFYLLHAYVVMPDHLHLLLTPGESTSLEKAVQLIKGGSSHEIGEKHSFKLPVWHVSFTEHLIRDENDFDSHVRYIEMNPVEAELTTQPDAYLFCSASEKHRLDEWPVASGAKAPGVFAAFSRRG